MPTVRCDRCDAECSEAEVKAGWCENCGKKLPAYLLLPPVKERAALTPVATSSDEDAPPAVEVFRPSLVNRLLRFSLMALGGGAAGFAAVWIGTHFPKDPNKQTEAAVACAVIAAMAIVLFSGGLAILIAGRIAIDEKELRHTRATLGGILPWLVTDRIPFDAVDRFGFGFTAVDYSLVVGINVESPMLMLRLAKTRDTAAGDHRMWIKYYPGQSQIIRLLRSRLRREPERLAPGAFGLGRFI